MVATRSSGRQHINGRISPTVEVLLKEQVVQAPCWTPQARGPASGRWAPGRTGFTDYWGLDIGELVKT